jgi:hypothetical protein
MVGKGPLAMGLCRVGSLMLGISASAQALESWWMLGALPLAYVAAITLVGRGEADGKNPFGKMAFFLVVSVVFLMGGLAWYFSRLFAFPYLALFAACVLPAFWKALKTPSPSVLRGAVKAGVLSVIIEAWRREYDRRKSPWDNESRPHSTLNDLSPAEFVRRAELCSSAPV